MIKNIKKMIGEDVLLSILEPLETATLKGKCVTEKELLVKSNLPKNVFKIYFNMFMPLKLIEKVIK